MALCAELCSTATLSVPQKASAGLLKVRGGLSWILLRSVEAFHVMAMLICAVSID